MTPRTLRTPGRILLAALAVFVLLRPLPAQTGRDARSSIVIVVGQLATLPIPTLMEGPAATVANSDVADQLFLRLAGPGPTLTTSGDQGFVPLLARSWTRRDSVTLVFDLDPRARWHDGVPVTARDVVFTLERARMPAIAPRVADLLRHIRRVRAEGERRVVVEYTHPYAEQLYDAVWHVAPLPAHLVAAIPPDQLARSALAQHPVGTGPYRWVRSMPGQFIELAADDEFFLGRPKIERVIVRLATDPNARLNLLLGGEADALGNVSPPLANLQRVAAVPDLRLIPSPSPTVGYLLFNRRNPADTTRPHPILADLRVRRAIGLALDRRLMVQAVFGAYGQVPYGPVSSLLWIRHGAPTPLAQDLPAARRLLAEAGWRDTDGDGLLDREGRPLLLGLNLPNTSAIRRQLALLVQEQLRQVGIRLELRQLEAPVWAERRSAGGFDVDFSSASQDPSPTGLVQSWSCGGGSNVAHYCNPRVDSLIDFANRTVEGAAPIWHAVLRQIEADAPAVFLYAPVDVYAVHRRFARVVIYPASSWMALWRWSTDPPDGASAGWR